MKFKVGDIVEIKENFKNYFERNYQINKNDLLFVAEEKFSRFSCALLPDKRYKILLSKEEISLFDVKEEDVL